MFYNFLVFWKKKQNVLSPIALKYSISDKKKIRFMKSLQLNLSL